MEKGKILDRIGIVISGEMRSEGKESKRHSLAAKGIKTSIDGKMVGDSTRKKLYIPRLDFYDEEEYTPVAEVYYDERGEKNG